jgi:hypothetical protein
MARRSGEQRGLRLPGDHGRVPVAAATAATSDPLPGAMPRACGIDMSVFVATQTAPAAIA